MNQPMRDVLGVLALRPDAIRRVGASSAATRAGAVLLLTASAAPFADEHPVVTAILCGLLALGHAALLGLVLLLVRPDRPGALALVRVYLFATPIWLVLATPFDRLLDPIATARWVAGASVLVALWHGAIVGQACRCLIGLGRRGSLGRAAIFGAVLIGVLGLALHGPAMEEFPDPGQEERRDVARTLLGASGALLLVAAGPLVVDPTGGAPPAAPCRIPTSAGPPRVAALVAGCLSVLVALLAWGQAGRVNERSIEQDLTAGRFDEAIDRFERAWPWWVARPAGLATGEPGRALSTQLEFTRRALFEDRGRLPEWFRRQVAWRLARIVWVFPGAPALHALRAEHASAAERLLVDLARRELDDYAAYRFLDEGPNVSGILVAALADPEYEDLLSPESAAWLEAFRRDPPDPGIAATLREWTPRR